MKKILFALVLAVASVTLAPAQDLAAIVSEVSEAIQLDSAQGTVLGREMGKYAVSLQLIFDRYEEAEPDPQAMLSDIKHAREEYYKALEPAIGKEKFQAYLGYVEQVKLQMLESVAELRLLDLKAPLLMTDEQVQGMKPIMARSMLDIFQTLMKYVDKPMNLRTKLGAATELKSIKKTFEQETSSVLTSEQMRKWQEIREAAKEQQGK